MAGVDEQARDSYEHPESDARRENESVHVEIEVPEDEKEAQEQHAPEPSDAAAEAARAAEFNVEDEPAPGYVDADGLEGLSEEDLAQAAQAAGERAAREEIAADEQAVRAECKELSARLEAAEARAQDATERLARLQADWENFRKRTAAERLAERERATEKLVTNILPVIDDLERAVEHASASAGGQSDVASQLADGVDAVRVKLVDVLGKEGVEVIDPAGEPFEPLEHQAVGKVDDANEYEDTVRDVYQRGYRMGGKVIRPAMVTVTAGGPKRPDEDSQDNPAPSDSAASDNANDSSPEDEAGE